MRIVVLERNWWALGLRGAVAVLFGLVALLHPTIGFVALVALVGAWLLVDGVLAVVAAVVGTERRVRWWPLLAEGGTGIAAGAAAYLLPGLTVSALLYIVAAWAGLTGAFRVIAALRVRHAIEGEWLLMASGVLSLLFGALLATSPATGVVTLALGVGVFALLEGLMLLVLAARLYDEWRTYGSPVHYRRSPSPWDSPHTPGRS